MRVSFLLLIGALFLSQSFAYDLFEDDAHLISKRAVTYCPNVTCASSPLNQPCQPISTCNNCNATYTACKASLTPTSTAAEVCACFSVGYNCSYSSPQCWELSNLITTECTASASACSVCKAVKAQPNLVRQCSADGYCSDSGFCTQKGTRNTTCTRDEQCADISAVNARPYYCQNGICGFQPNTIQANDLCSSDGDCIGGALCTKGQCAGIKKDLSCIGAQSLNCEPGTFCYSSTGICTAQYVSGATCSLSEINQCGLGLFCSPNNLTCVPYFSSSATTSCTAGRFECAYGSLCLNGKCVVTGTNYLVACSSDADCPGSECICSIDGRSRCRLNALPVKKTCDRDYQTALACALRNRCTSISDDPTTCCGAYCSQEMNCLYSCVYDSFSLEVGKAFGCPYYPKFNKCRIQYSSDFYLPTSPRNDTDSGTHLVPLLSTLLLFLF